MLYPFVCCSDEIADEASGTSTFGRGGKGGCGNGGSGRSQMTLATNTKSLAARWRGGVGGGGGARSAAAGAAAGQREHLMQQRTTSLESPQQEITYVPTSALKGGDSRADGGMLSDGSEVNLVSCRNISHSSQGRRPHCEQQHAICTTCSTHPIP